jgi:hypothetical protein
VNRLEQQKSFTSATACDTNASSSVVELPEVIPSAEAANTETVAAAGHAETRTEVQIEVGPEQLDVEAANEAGSTGAPPNTVLPQPDGGWRAWSVVMGATMSMSATFGLMTAIGLFQVYWQEHQLASDDPTRISWIISVFGFLSLFLAAHAGALFDRFGARWLLIGSALMYAGSFLGLAYSTEYAHFMGCFIVAGVGAC